MNTHEQYACVKPKAQSFGLLHFLLLAALVSSIGCPASYETTKRSELRELGGKGPLRVLTADSTLYTFETFSFSETELNGQGTSTKNGITKPFDGSLPFTTIAFIERLETSIWKGVWVVPMVLVAAPYIVQLVSDPPKFDISRPVGVGSCPYVYANDGTSFRLEAEAFGTSVSKAFETETFSVLPSLVSIAGNLSVRVSNERPETHLINSVHLFVGDEGEASSAVLDVDNTLWPVLKAHPPMSAQDHSGRNILANVALKDKRYWQSDLANTEPSSGFRDNLSLEFVLPPEASEATLIVDAVNTDLVTEAYRAAGSVLGDATMQFYDALERNPELQNTIREWIRDCSLRIEVEGRSGWKEVGLMPPEANVAPFTRAIRIQNLRAINGPLHIRLSSLTDVWRIDAVTIDCSTVTPIPLRPLEMTSVSSSDHQQWKNALVRSDSTYAVLLPPNYLDVAFDAAPAKKVQKPVYVFAAQGFLYEWLPSSENKATVAGSIEKDNRVRLFTLIIQHKDLFLPAVYAEWRQNGYRQ